MTTPPVAVVCIGMAGMYICPPDCGLLLTNRPGSGKTTFMQRINNYLHVNKKKPYVLNLDPAVIKVPFQPNIDIRDSINYKEVMKQYNLGPNGGILTSLNLFATKIDQVIGLLEKRANPGPESTVAPPKHILVDTPGQIEVFVWSASGSILLESLASSFPTVIAYIIDTPRTSSTSTFMSNMLYACSILYKTKLPMILVFNKTDVQDADFAREWMTDFEKFQEALHEEENKGVFGGEGFGGSGYMGSLLNSMSMVLEEFYSHLNMVAVSSMTGDGIDDFFEAVEEKRKEFERDYRPELERRRTERENETAKQREHDLTKVMKDMNVSGSSKAAKKAEVEDESSDEDEDVDANDPDEYPDAEKDDDDEESLKRRYKNALREQGIQVDDDDPTIAQMLAQTRRT
jgi:GTPase SAR1 family protein